MTTPRNTSKGRSRKAPAITDTSATDTADQAEMNEALAEIIKAAKPSRPNAERRNEATHADGAAAVAWGKCPKCGARKGVRCTSQRGEPTNFVHAPRMAAWDNS